MTTPVDVLVIAAHPDDSEFGAAGTVAKWIREGRRVAYLVCTSGEKGTTDPSLAPETVLGIREEEQRAAARVLGVQEVVFLRLPDQGLEDTAEFRKLIAHTLDDRKLPRPDRIVLISPMIGITSLARFAGVFGWPAVFPAFAKAAWLGVVPEFNPFKYNSFPVNGARQSSLVARRLQENIASHARDGRLVELPPIITFQSVVDFTVSTRAIVNALYANLPPNGSELVLFDLNRSAKLGPLLRRNTNNLLERLLPAPPRSFRTPIITNAATGDPEVVERVTEAGATTEQTRELELIYPRDVFSLSHLALPFPIDDMGGIMHENRNTIGSPHCHHNP